MHQAYCDRCDAPVDWVDAATAAKGILHVSKGRVHQLIKDGRFPNAKEHQPRNGRSFYRIPLADLAAYLAAREGR